MAEPHKTTKLLDLLSQVTEPEVDAEIEVLQARLRMLRAIKAALSGNGAAPVNLPAPPASAQKTVPVESKPESETPPRPAPSDKKPLILALMRQQPAKTWGARTIRAELIARDEIDPNTTIESMRVTLRRMVLRGQLVKVGVDYKLAGVEQGELS